eukprot:CAMPEP_0172168966 /NCGR_PEP_ID=MMETSP1050-20130122/10443_1 /TAXON_ID=233186 /ORGANISM="Cryptomonas curvata, Strain CCAP979/52" /LENGTH=83 /DNA_ID=CAMNT_0012839971 /DNA_START=2008 /DNA_END=2259 /DNA_ORIENTATION=-
MDIQSGSTSESTGEGLIVSRFSKGPPSSDSQSCGEGQADQSVRGFLYEDIPTMEPVGRTGEGLPNVVAVEQGERRGEGQAAPA